MPVSSLDENERNNKGTRSRKIRAEAENDSGGKQAGNPQ